MINPATKKYLFPFILSSLIFFTYYRLFNNYFEQDEWAVFADMIIFNNLSLIDKLRLTFTSSGILSHFIPLTIFLTFITNKIFGMNYMFYAALSIVLHTANVLVLFLVMNKIVKNKIIAFSTALLFGIHFLSSQAVTWISASLGAQTSTLAFLASVLFFQISIEKKKGFFFILSILMFVFSFLFKETSLTLVILYPLLLLGNEKSFKLKKILSKKLLLFPLSVIGYFLIKYIFSILIPHAHPVSSSQSFTSPFIILLKLILLPVLALSQIYDVSGLVFENSREILKSFYPSLTKYDFHPLIYETVVPDVVYVLFSTIIITIILLTIFCMVKEKSERQAKLVAIFLICFFASIFPFVILPRFSSFLEQRYYYTANIFSSGLLSMVLYYWVLRLVKGNIYVVIYLVLISIIVGRNYFLIQENLKQKEEIATARKSIINQITSQQKTLVRSKNIFYITGNGNDYLIEGLKIPFQSGFGNILMVQYFSSGKIPYKLVDGGFLYQLADQGYKEQGEYGFGYYFEQETFKKDLLKYKSAENNIHAFFWDSKNKKITNYKKELLDDIK